MSLGAPVRAALEATAKRTQDANLLKLIRPAQFAATAHKRCEVDKADQFQSASCASQKTAMRRSLQVVGGAECPIRMVGLVPT